MASNSKIDVHAHFVPPCWRDALLVNGFEHPDGMPAIPNWDVQSHINLMDAMGIEKSYLSITSPGVHLVAGDNASARQLARECNTFAYNLKRQMPDRFGSFVSLPLPDLEGSINELKYAIDSLKADGIVLQTNYYGKYIGSSYFRPIFEELNCRGMVVFIHPTSPCVQGCRSHEGLPLPQYPAPVFEFMFDTCRCIIDLILSGAISKYPNIRYVVPHAGGALPPLIQRFSEAVALIPDLSLDVTMTPSSVKALLNERFWFDTAGPTFPDQIKSLLQNIQPDRICYGTDFPFTPFQGVNHLNQVMEDNLDVIFDNQADREGLYRGNASRLLGIESSRIINS
ncbi:aminocarboxymuconate-semialdehyde decarboxylase [Talaromyces proteolyticus]|uniref:6-methylsalicylate decarboxylase n=1 Tax=Talaromyces proteolyticus TaxID=1131652 RepID=A0AAD4Q167_9EURO|nr:aminocarboxymuconate-semialdehyde decarboxylase [Talaromyces proteolyticus]KAH8697938.1 aminocarboxymuconate-semialdehyde decarboxylase [Talaromyces proteolyticus]